ncbi:hypothetical protein [Chishuiella sp.]|uniref:hypothetical protein n=1 Tax=Chishuiella sp. TaxID=1969467 RepID=UPI0028AD1BA3|nr:hypothetical protein [Chishuiella sp.]
MKNKLLIILTLILISSIMLSFNIFKSNPEEDFWKWFEKNEKFIYENVENKDKQEKVFDDISSRLHKIDENLVFEFSPIHENNIREFSVSADGIKESFPAVEKLIAISPRIKNWQFNAFRQRIPGDELTLDFGKFKIGYDDIYFRHSTSNNELGVELNIRNYDESAQMQNAIYVLLDGLLGEYDVTMNIKWIEWVKLDENNVENLDKLTELRDLIDSRKK